MEAKREKMAVGVGKRWMKRKRKGKRCDASECTLFPRTYEPTRAHQSSEFRVGHVISGAWDSFDVRVRSARTPIGCW